MRKAETRTDEMRKPKDREMRGTIHETRNLQRDEAAKRRQQKKKHYEKKR